MNKYGRKKEEVSLAVDSVIFGILNEKFHILLIRGTKKELKKSWLLPGGLVEYGNSLENQIKLILTKKTGIKKILFDQLATFGNPDRDPFGHVVSVAYIALVNIDEHILKTTNQYDEIKWFELEKLPKLGFDHKKIIEVAKNRLKNKIMYTNIVQGILNDEFTLTELQKVYEVILNKKFDKRNFRKKILSLGMVEKTEKKKGITRPAFLYKFKVKKIKEYQIN